MKPRFHHIPTVFALLVILLTIALGGCSQPPTDIPGTYVYDNGNGTNSLLKLNLDYSCEMIFEAGTSRTKIWDGKWEFDGSIVKVSAPRFGVTASYERVGKNLHKLSSPDAELFSKR